MIFQASPTALAAVIVVVIPGVATVTTIFLHLPPVFIPVAPTVRTGVFVPFAAMLPQITAILPFPFAPLFGPVPVQLSPLPFQLAVLAVQFPFFAVFFLKISRGITAAMITVSKVRPGAVDVYINVVIEVDPNPRGQNRGRNPFIMVEIEIEPPAGIIIDMGGGKVLITIDLPRHPPGTRRRRRQAGREKQTGKQRENGDG